MDLAPGDPLLAGLDGATALRHLRRILARLPAQLADTMAAVHRIDPAPVMRRGIELNRPKPEHQVHANRR